jgi:hypothetical protein
MTTFGIVCSSRELMHSTQALDPLLKPLGGSALHRLDIAARAKAASGAGDYDRADFGNAGQALERLAQSLKHRGRERIQPIGPIELQPGDPAFGRFQQVAHFTPLTSTALPRRRLIIRRRIIVG